METDIRMINTIHFSDWMAFLYSFFRKEGKKKNQIYVWKGDPATKENCYENKMMEGWGEHSW